MRCPSPSRSRCIAWSRSIEPGGSTVKNGSAVSSRSGSPGGAAPPARPRRGRRPGSRATAPARRAPRRTGRAAPRAPRAGCRRRWAPGAHGGEACDNYAVVVLLRRRSGRTTRPAMRRAHRRRPSTSRRTHSFSPTGVSRTTLPALGRHPPADAEPSRTGPPPSTSGAGCAPTSTSVPRVAPRPARTTASSTPCERTSGTRTRRSPDRSTSTAPPRASGAGSVTSSRPRCRRRASVAEHRPHGDVVADLDPQGSALGAAAATHRRARPHPSATSQRVPRSPTAWTASSSPRRATSRTAQRPGVGSSAAQVDARHTVRRPGRGARRHPDAAGPPTSSTRRARPGWRVARGRRGTTGRRSSTDTAARAGTSARETS